MEISHQGLSAVERLGVGLAVLGIGVALVLGLPPAWWSAMPPNAVHAGVGIGVVLILVGSFLIINSAWTARRGHKMWPILGMAFFGLGFVGCAAWYFWPEKTISDPPKVTLQAPIPALGSLQYVVFTAHVVRQNSTKRTAVQMMVRVKNTNDFLVQYHVKMRGNVNGKSPSPSDTEFDGYVPPNDTRELMYTRIEDVPVNEHPEAFQPVLRGMLDYDVVYWGAQNPAGKRETKKTCIFEMIRPFDPNVRPDEYREEKYETVTKISNESEK